MEGVFRAVDRAARASDPDGVVFVEIGANDGRFADPLFPFVSSLGWRGVLVEPLPDVFALLQDNYKGFPNLRFENAAITEAGGATVREIRRVPLAAVREMEAECVGRPHAGMCGYAIGVASFKDDEHAHWVLREKGVTEEVKCMSLQELLDKHSIRTFHVFQVDTEGYDAEIVNQLDLAKHRPMVIQMEADHLSPSGLLKVLSRLADAGYAFRTSGGDLLAFLPSIFSPQAADTHAGRDEL
ncbi:S-adenosyl-L-methionine-dependent methyltransferase [Baffinella frigidus]|nr:S-adenosyl-L-methionine-dependent methyltransferase [Cryptophyta sp. CCMP2293]